MKRFGYIDLPANRGPGGFEHADIHSRSHHLYVAHTSNNALDVIDIEQDKYIRSIGGLTGVAGALVSEERGLVFTSQSRREHRVAFCSWS